MSDTSEATVDGVRYLSAAQAAKEFGFVRDYIGRLCRQGLVQGKQIGANWYVDPQSLQSFLKERDQRRSQRNEALRRVFRATQAESNATSTTDETSGTSLAIPSPVTTLAPHALLAHARRRRFADRRASVIEPNALSLLLVLIIAANYAVFNPAFAQSTLQSIQTFATTSAHRVELAVTAIPNVSASVQAQVALAAENPAGTAHSVLAIAHSFARAFTTGINDFVSALFPKRNSGPNLAYTRTDQVEFATPLLVPASLASVRESTTTTVINNYPVVQRIIEHSLPVATPAPLTDPTFVTQVQMQRGLSALDASLRQLVFQNVSAPLSLPSSGGFANNIALTQRIDQLSGTSLSNITVTGVSGLTDSDIPDAITASNYLPLTGGSVSGDLTVSGTITGVASTSAAIAQNATTTNFFAINASTTNATSTTVFSVLGHFSTGIIDALTTAIATIANLTTTELVATNATTTNLIAANATTTNARIQNLSAPTASTTNLTWANAIGTNAIVTNATSTNLFSTTASSTNLFASAAQFGSLSLLTALPIASGGTNATSFSAGQPLAFDGTRLVSSSTLAAVYGGTGQSTYAAGDILYASGGNTLARLAMGSAGQVLKVSGGLPGWGADLTTSGGASIFATTTDSLAIYPSTVSSVLLLGASATTTTGNIFEALGNFLLRGTLTAYNTVTAPAFTATSTTVASTFSGGFLAGASSTVTTGLFSMNGGASTTAFTNAGNMWLTGVAASSLLALDSNNKIVATSSVGVNLLTGTLPAGNGGTGISSVSAAGLLVGNYAGTAWQQLATSSLGLLTTNVAEGSNLYFTTNRVASVIAGTTTDALAQGSTNKYYSTLLFAGDLAGTTTNALAEGSTNKFYTDARVGSYISGSSTVPHIGGSAYGDLLSWTGSAWSTRATSTLALNTGDLVEGLNLFWTNVRFDNRLAATTTLPNITTLANLATVGTITSGTWNGSIVGVPYGGTGWSNITAGAIPYGNGASALATTSAGAAGYVLAYLNGVPTWTATTTLATISGTLNLSNQVSNTLGIANGGTGATSFGQGWMYSSGATGALAASTSPTVNYIVATSSTASILPYASSTALTVSGTNGLVVGSLTGPLQASNGVVTASSTLSEFYGGTGNSSYATGDLLYASAGAKLSRLAVGTQGATGVFGVSSGLPAWVATSTLGINFSNLVGKVSASQGGTNVDTSAASGVAVIDAGTWSASTTLNVYRGGTGAATFASNGILYGNGAGSIQALAVNSTATKKYLQQVSSGTPAWAQIAAADLSDGTTGTGAIILSASPTLTGTAAFANTTNSGTLAVTGLSTFGQASTTLFSSYGPTYFGGSATSSFSNAGVLTLASALTVGNGGTGSTTLTGILKGNGTSAVQTAVGGSDYEFPLTFATGLTRSTNTITLNTATANTWSALQQFSSGASSTQLSVTSKAYFGGSATSTFDSAGALTLASALTVGNGGTGATSLSGLLQGNGSSAISGITGTAGQFPYYNGTNTLLATSSLFLATSGNVGIGTTSPTGLLHVGSGSAATNASLFLDGGTNSGKGGYIQFNRGSVLTGAIGTNSVLEGGTSDDLTLFANTNNNIRFYGGTAGATEVMRIQNGGNVGIGTTTPAATFSVAGNSYVSGKALFPNTVAPGSTQAMSVGTSTDHVGVSGYGQLVVAGASANYGYGVAAQAGISNYAGVYGLSQDGTTASGQLGYNNDYGVYCTGTHCGGNQVWTNSSDERLKTNINTLSDQSGLAAINQLRPVTFHWKDAKIDAVNGEQLGFIAQDAGAIFPQLLAGMGTTTITLADGSTQTIVDTKGLSYAGFVVPLVKAVQEIASLSDTFKNTLIAWFANTTNGIHDLYAGIVHSQEDHTQKLCVGDTCVTPAQFQAMVAASNESIPGASGTGNATPPPSSDNGSSTTPDTEPPVITINGDNPAHINVGDTYSDLGVGVTDNVGKNLGYKTFLNGTLVSNIVIDTSSEATDTIDYVATDTAGNIATSTRTVIVDAAAVLPPQDEPATTTDTASTSQ